MTDSAISKTERFLKVGPYALWFGMNTIIGLALSYQRDGVEAIYFLLNFFLMGSIIIWFFGFKLFPIYLESDGKVDQKLGLRIGVFILLFLIGLSNHFTLPKLLGLEAVAARHSLPLLVRLGMWNLMILTGVILMASIRVANAYHQAQVEKIEQQIDRVQTELKLLKTQISPHFLFNTLNNIYGLAYMKDDRAAQMISKLSQIMRYLLDDCEQPQVPLAKERDLLEHYLSLQLLKHQGTMNVDFYHAGVQHSHRIIPMVLINFVENCFKHSDLETNSEGWIKVSMEVEKDHLHFRTENTIRKEVGERTVNRQGIGLTNAIKLLEANYPDRHQVSIEKNEQVYQLDVTLNLCA